MSKIKGAEDALREVLAISMREADRMLLEHIETAQWQEAVATMRAVQCNALDAVIEYHEGQISTCKTIISENKLPGAVELAEHLMHWHCGGIDAVRKIQEGL